MCLFSKFLQDYLQDFTNWTIHKLLLTHSDYQKLWPHTNPLDPQSSLFLSYPHVTHVTPLPQEAVTADWRSALILNQKTGSPFLRESFYTPPVKNAKAMAPHSSTLAWKIPWMEEPGALQSMGSLGVEHDWATSLSLFTSMHWRRKWQPTPVFLPGESQGWGSLWAAVYGVAQSWTRLTWLSSSEKFSEGMFM